MIFLLLLPAPRTAPRTSWKGKASITCTVVHTSSASESLVSKTELSYRLAHNNHSAGVLPFGPILTALAAARVEKKGGRQ